MRMREAREQIVEYGKKMSAAGLSAGTSGNLSVYDPEVGLMAITPSGMDYFETAPEDVVVTDLEGVVAEGTRKPSSEWALHAAFYRRKQGIRGVVHTHSVFCTTLAVLHEPIRAVHYVVADTGADTVPCAPYVTFGTPELAETAIGVCGAGRAVLLANHGMVACGDSLRDAYSLACNLEFVAQLQYQAMCAGEPHVLTDREMTAAMRRFQTYGQSK